MKTTHSLIITIVLALGFGFAGAAAWQYSGLGDGYTRQYLVSNPDILPEMAEAYEAEQIKDRLSEAGDGITTPFPGAVLGNPNGDVTLVEFTDYGCGYCRMSREHVDALIAANPDLKVVIREWPIFEGSDKAAVIALAAAEQGKFAEFHRAMFTAGNPSPATIAQAADQAGIDIQAAQKFADSDKARAEFSKNAGLAQALAFTGTPAWVVGDKVIEGAVGVTQLQEAIDTARGL